jgi:hypothetical protein
LIVQRCFPRKFGLTHEWQKLIDKRGLRRIRSQPKPMPSRSLTVPCRRL